MKIKLSNSDKVVLIDATDYDWLNQYTWHVISNGYAKAWVKDDMMFMHRLILGLKRNDGIRTDHINGNKLDNRRSNLRIATRSQNRANTKHYKKRSPNASRFKGVRWVKKTSKWRAIIFTNGRAISLGHFHDEEEAARAYDKAAIDTWGEFARTNF